MRPGPLVAAAVALASACAASAWAPAAPAGAQELPPPCSPERAGLVACVAGKLCACRFARGGAASGLPDGFRWDCGVLRPGCGGAGDGRPATLDRYPYPLPPALGLGGREHPR